MILIKEKELNQTLFSRKNVFEINENIEVLHNNNIDNYKFQIYNINNI